MTLKLLVKAGVPVTESSLFSLSALSQGIQLLRASWVGCLLPRRDHQHLGSFPRLVSSIWNNWDGVVPSLLPQPHRWFSTILGHHTVNWGGEKIWDRNLSLGGKRCLQVLIWQASSALGEMMFNTDWYLRSSETAQAWWPCTCVLISSTQYPNIPSIPSHTWVLPRSKSSFWRLLMRSPVSGAEISLPPSLYTTVPHLHKLSLFNYLSRCPNCVTSDLWMN